MVCAFRRIAQVEIGWREKINATKIEQLILIGCHFEIQIQTIPYEYFNSHSLNNVQGDTNFLDFGVLFDQFDLCADSFL